MANALSDARDREILEAFCRFYTVAMGKNAVLIDLPDAASPGQGLPDGRLALGGVEWDAEVGGADNYGGQREDHARTRHIRTEVRDFLKEKFPDLTITILIRGGEVPNKIDYPVLKQSIFEKISSLKLEFDSFNPVDNYSYIEVCAHVPIGGIRPIVFFGILRRDPARYPLTDVVREFLEKKEEQHKAREARGRKNPTILLVDLWDISLSNYQHFAIAYAQLIRDGLRLLSIQEVWLVTCYDGKAYCNPIKLGDRYYTGTHESLMEFQDMNKFNK